MARIVKRLRNGPYTDWYDSTRQRHDAAEIHPEMCTEQQLQSW